MCWYLLTELKLVKISVSSCRTSDLFDYHRHVIALIWFSNTLRFKLKPLIKPIQCKKSYLGGILESPCQFIHLSLCLSVDKTFPESTSVIMNKHNPWIILFHFTIQLPRWPPWRPWWILIKIVSSRTVSVIETWGFVFGLITLNTNLNLKVYDFHCYIGTASRTVASTNMNATSSRAHTVVTITFDQIIKDDTGSETKKSSVMNLVDLAGNRFL